MKPIDLLTFYREHLYKSAFNERRDPSFCRISLQLCQDFIQSDLGKEQELQVAIFSVLKQARWRKTGLERFFGPSWLSYEMAHSHLGPFWGRDEIFLLVESVIATAKNYRIQLFGQHGSTGANQRQFKIALLYLCININRGMPWFKLLPHIEVKT